MVKKLWKIELYAESISRSEKNYVEVLHVIVRLSVAH